MALINSIRHIKSRGGGKEMGKKNKGKFLVHSEGYQVPKIYKVIDNFVKIYIDNY